MWLFLLLSLLTLLYAGLMHRFKRGWDCLSPFSPSPSTAPLPLVTLLIPARNEAANIGKLLEAIQQQTYPAKQLEVIVINDHSTDETVWVAQQFSFAKLIHLTDEHDQAHKKRALEKGIAQAKGSFIVCTDADCVPRPKWIETMVQYHLQKKVVFAAAPVLLENDHSILGRFQTLDFLVLQGITAAGIQQGFIYMANGANMGYTKAVFEEVEGYKGVRHVASGDDFFLLHKIKDRYPHQIGFVQSADTIVRTAAMPSWSTFLHQRIRWASKSTHYRSRSIQFVLLLVWLYNLAFIAGLFLALENLQWLYVVLIALLIKTALEWPFVKSVANFFQLPLRKKTFFLFQPLHILYITLTGVLGFRGSYKWKGRKVH
jgi:biofilm PGA synthesis N-glycosyltransferase PgaC